MKTTFATIIHAAPKFGVEELMNVRKMLSALLDESFVKECDTNYALINPVVAENIDIKKIDEGEVILRLVNLAKEKNVDYIPSQTAAQALHAYCLRKGIAPPESLSGGDNPIYAPQPMAYDPNLDAGVDAGAGAGAGAGGFGGGGMPSYQPVMGGGMQPGM
jgi:hypothetical protein